MQVFFELQSLFKLVKIKLIYNIMKRILIFLFSISILSCDKKVGETKLNPDSNPELKYVGFQKLSNFLYLDRNFKTKTNFENDTLNSPFFEVSPKKGNSYEIYSLDSIFSGFVEGGYGSEYSKHFTSNKLTQKQIDDYNLEELFRRQKISVDAQFKQWDGTHIPTTKYIKSRLKDPGSFEQIELGYQFTPQGSEVAVAFGFDDSSVLVAVEYTAKNSYGGRVRGEFRAFWNIDGSLKLVIKDE